MAEVLSIKCPFCKKDLPLLRSKRNRDYSDCKCCFISAKEKAKDFYKDLEKINLDEKDA